MTFALASQVQFYLPWGQRPFSIVSYNRVLNVKVRVVAYNQAKALVDGSFAALIRNQTGDRQGT